MATISDVAAKAGVGVGTVSHVLNGSHQVRPTDARQGPGGHGGVGVHPTRSPSGSDARRRGSSVCSSRSSISRRRTSASAASSGRCRLHGLEIVLLQRRRPRPRPRPPAGSSTPSARRPHRHLAPAAVRRRRPARRRAVPDRVGGHVAPSVAERRRRRSQRWPDRHRVPGVAGPRAHRVHRRAGAQPVRLHVEPQPRGRLRRRTRRRRHRPRSALHEVRPARPDRGPPARGRAVHHGGTTDGGGRGLRCPGVRRHRRRAAQRQRRATRCVGHRLRRHRSRRVQRLDHGAPTARGVRTSTARTSSPVRWRPGSGPPRSSRSWQSNWSCEGRRGLRAAPRPGAG